MLSEETLELLHLLNTPYFHTEDRKQLFKVSPTRVDADEYHQPQQNLLEDLHMSQSSDSNNDFFQSSQTNSFQLSSPISDIDSPSENDGQSVSLSDSESAPLDANKPPNSTANPKKRKKEITKEIKNKQELVSFLTRKPTPGVGYRLDQFARYGSFFISGWSPNTMSTIQSKKPPRVVIKKSLFDFCENHTGKTKKNIRRSFASFMNNIGFVNESRYKRGKMIFRPAKEGEIQKRPSRKK
ncbi:hypothetical protein M0811_05658 [Anaeramoeba ignava]|uniref:Uncharacterized protein n=1 Tax=Anaeramoeba ignava TaxID=1746090 RepID=A0A9Q0REX9_ANAIG|nr:hypothetical protein M0811_05658 [Anaeramoeba ignava]|eukprot:Anaeramoba_ignava/a347921_74.p1 GENE.a347921_74~~a347921_74.p1  ORF type:complete len:240 (-),score=64.37 a347921_74:71-790(-)